VFESGKRGFGIITIKGNSNLKVIKADDIDKAQEAIRKAQEIHKVSVQN